MYAGVIVRGVVQTLQMSLILATLHTMSHTSGHMASRSFCSVSMLLSSALCSRAAATQLSLASRSARILATSPLWTCTSPKI